jgi:SET domain
MAPKRASQRQAESREKAQLEPIGREPSSPPPDEESNDTEPHDIVRYPPLSRSSVLRYQGKLEIRAASDMGMGVFVRKGSPIAVPGEILFKEAPLIQIANSECKAPTLRRQRLEQAYSRMSEHQKQQLAHLYWGKNLNRPEHINDLVSRLVLNCWSPDDRDASFLYYAGCLMNHSCRPNVILDIDPRTNEMTCVAITEIWPGDQLYVSYLYFTDLLRPYTERRKVTKETFLFDCKCALCAQQAACAKIKKVDSETRTITQLLKNLGVYIKEVEMVAPKHNLSNAAQRHEAQCEVERLIKLLVDSSLVQFLANAYAQACYIWACCSDETQRKHKVCEYTARIRSHRYDFRHYPSVQLFSKHCDPFIVANSYERALGACAMHSDKVKGKDTLPAGKYAEWSTLKQDHGLDQLIQTSPLLNTPPAAAPTEDQQTRTTVQTASSSGTRNEGTEQTIAPVPQQTRKSRQRDATRTTNFPSLRPGYAAPRNVLELLRQNQKKKRKAPTTQAGGGKRRRK